MNKLTVLVLTAALVLYSGWTFAQDTGMKKNGMMDKAEMMAGDMMGKGMMGKGMCPMMKSMMERSVVATSDGGVIVLSGCTLTKYDKNLNMVKEAQIKCDMMKKGCPMMGHGKMGMMDDDDDDADEKAPAAAPAADVDHASHH